MVSFSSICKLSKFWKLGMELFFVLKCTVRNWRNFLGEVIGSHSWCLVNNSLAWSSRDQEILNNSCGSFMWFNEAQDLNVEIKRFILDGFRENLGKKNKFVLAE